MRTVSVLIPVYNAEQYLRECVDSVLNQSYQDLEIILINDGSTDSSGLLIEQLKLQDSRVKVFHKSHKEGIGAARNTALDMARGDYVVFIDADDWMDPNHIEDLVELLERTGADISIANFTRFYMDDQRYEIHITDADYYEMELTPEEWFRYQYGQPHNLSLCFTVPWGKLYKRSLFETVTYYTGGFGEDDRTTWKLYLMSDKIAYMHRSSLIYRVNATSMTQMSERVEVFSEEPVLERLALLSILGFDLSQEIAAFKWRAQLNRDDRIRSGQMQAYKNLEFTLKLLEKYNK
ncbi:MULTISPECIES: glycosyltransferase family 2 protein [unclassified Streptococcus]|uniref:glycosyltransferase family 2 protein n=1 Tax=unclassified Streptococcus TaxID=2608887 RepID=UPI0018AB6F41|nr:MULTISPECIES: glycosyltransferase family 2 protein [unclassified Streptococcus]MBF8970455.1 glycosyltransferase family 2 protein [Streptococcus sp. NLN76]MBG9366830.1 glycosyltransferase family 2 protein [Streptococcus sp. NLN64]